MDRYVTTRAWRQWAALLLCLVATLFCWTKAASYSRLTGSSLTVIAKPLLQRSPLRVQTEADRFPVQRIETANVPVRTQRTAFPRVMTRG